MGNNTAVSHFESREDLKQYGNNAWLLFALELKLGTDEIQEIAAQSLTDGHDDKKCDLIYVDRDTGVAIVAQSYFTERVRKSASANKASDLNTAISWIFHANSDDLPPFLRVAIQDLRDGLKNNEINSLELWFVHNCPESENVRRELNIAESNLTKTIASRYKNTDIDIKATEIGANYVEALFLSSETPIAVNETFEFNVSAGFNVASGNWRAFISTIKVQEIKNIFEQYKDELFSANVRGYLGSLKRSSNINSGIKKTLQENPEDFWVFNNGITALVNSIDFNEPESKLTIGGLSIVNGAQTTGAIGAAEKVGDACVSVRFVQCSDKSLVKQIVVNNNRQNPIEPSDYRSNDQVQRRLRKEFKDLRNCEYNGGRRGGSSDSIVRHQNKLLAAKTCGQVLAAFHGSPEDAQHKKSDIWRSDSLYSKYFSERTSARHVAFVFALSSAINSYKLNLKNQTNYTKQQKRHLGFLQMRGSSYIYLASIASSLEIILERQFPHLWNLCFKTFDFEEMCTIWSSILEVTISFATSLDLVLIDSLRNKDAVKNSIRTFSDMVNAIKIPNSEVFRTFSRHVIVR